MDKTTLEKIRVDLLDEIKRLKYSMYEMAREYWKKEAKEKNKKWKQVFRELAIEYEGRADGIEKVYDLIYQNL
jgi:peroxiredoxin family protein